MNAPAPQPCGTRLPLRPYQADAVDAVEAAYRRGVKRSLVVIPTGGGKTVCFAHLVARRPGRALILAHRDELLSQAAGKLDAVSGPGRTGIVKADRDEHDAPVVVASVQTLARPGRLERLGRFDTVIVDEAHHAVASIYLDIMERLGCMDDDGGGPLTAGFTATAGRSDRVGLKYAWQEIVYQRGILQMIAEGYLVDVSATQIGADFQIANAQVRGGDYTDASLEKELKRSNAIEIAAAAYAEHAHDRLGVAFTPTVTSAGELAEALTGKGIPAEAVSGKMPLDKRRDILRRLHHGDLQVVPNAQTLTEGWDEPAVSCALMLRPTRSAPFFAQMIGRILRPYIGTVGTRQYTKTDALVIDVPGTAEEAGLATIADLAGLPPGSVTGGKSLLGAAEEQAAEQQRQADSQIADEQRQIAVGAARTRQIELLRRSDLRWISVDAAWVLPAGPDQMMILTPRHGDGDDAWDVWRCPRGGTPLLETGTPLALDWARGVGEEIARARGGVLSRSRAAWRDLPASPKQKNALRYIGRPVTPGLTRGEASDQMTAFHAARTIRALTSTGSTS